MAESNFALKKYQEEIRYNSKRFLDALLKDSEANWKRKYLCQVLYIPFSDTFGHADVRQNHCPLPVQFQVSGRT